jgi:hypothetical protein
MGQVYSLDALSDLAACPQYQAEQCFPDKAKVKDPGPGQFLSEPLRFSRDSSQCMSKGATLED